MDSSMQELVREGFTHITYLPFMKDGQVCLVGAPEEYWGSWGMSGTQITLVTAEGQVWLGRNTARAQAVCARFCPRCPDGTDDFFFDSGHNNVLLAHMLRRMQDPTAVCTTEDFHELFDVKEHRPVPA